MNRRVCALVLAEALLPTASSTVAIGNPNDFVRLPFTEAQCRVLIERGARFRIGNPDTAEGCSIIGGTSRGTAPSAPE